MNSVANADYALRRGRKAILLTLLMVITSLSPLMLITPASAHLTDNETVWPKQASNDTGWVQLTQLERTRILAYLQMLTGALNLLPEPCCLM